MRNLILHNWKVKLVCTLLAFVLWYIIRENVPGEPAWRQQPTPAAPSIWSPPPTLD